MAKTKSDAPLRIVKLVAENFKRLVAVEITPDGSVVEISGPNEAGKSSIMDAISAALGGEDQIPEMPIRKGEKEAEIRIDLGEIETEHKEFLDKLGRVKAETMRQFEVRRDELPERIEAE